MIVSTNLKCDYYCNRFTLMIVSTNFEYDDFLYNMTKIFVISFFSFKINFDINNCVISTLNFYDVYITCYRNEFLCFLTHRRNKIFLKS